MPGAEDRVLVFAEPTIATSLSNWLEEAGFCVAVADTWAAARALAASFVPDVILSDADIPTAGPASASLIRIADVELAGVKHEWPRADAYLARPLAPEPAVALVQSLARLRRAEQQLARASHELRTQLNAISGFAQLLASEHLHTDARAMVKEILHATDGLAGVAEDLLALSTDKGDTRGAIDADEVLDPPAAPTEATVLYIEDSPVNARLMVQVFKRYRPDLKLIVARDGESGLRMIDELHPDLLILDYHLPDVTGLSILEATRASGNHLPTFVLTADGSLELAKGVLDAGADGVLTKPFEIQQVQDLLAKYVPAFAFDR